MKTLQVIFWGVVAGIAWSRFKSWRNRAAPKKIAEDQLEQLYQAAQSGGSGNQGQGMMGMMGGMGMRGGMGMMGMSRMGMY